MGESKDEGRKGKKSRKEPEESDGKEKAEGGAQGEEGGLPGLRAQGGPQLQPPGQREERGVQEAVHDPQVGTEPAEGELGHLRPPLQLAPGSELLELLESRTGHSFHRVVLFCTLNLNLKLKP